jgi:hypothetical protein
VEIRSSLLTKVPLLTPKTATVRLKVFNDDTGSKRLGDLRYLYTCFEEIKDWRTVEEERCTLVTALLTAWP